MARQRSRTAEAKAGTGRAAFDQADALEGLIFARGGEQLALPGVRALRLVGVEAAPADDAEGDGARKGGRPPGSRNAAPEAWRRYLVARYGSVIEGMVMTATAPVASIAAELVHAWRTVAQASGITDPIPSTAQLLELVNTAAQMRLTAQRYAAPYQHSQAPQPVKAEGVVHRIAVGLFSGAAPIGGKVAQDVETSALAVLAGMLGVDPSAITNPLNFNNSRVSDAADLNAADLNAPSSEGA